VKRVALLFLIIPFLISCNKEKDPVVAEAYNFKLYRSEVVQNIPSGLSPEDSIRIYQQYIDHWLMERVILKAADNSLTINEKDFDKKIKRFKEQLLLEAFYNKITKDTLLFKVSDAELRRFISEFKESEPIQKNVVRVNYVKISKKSVIGNTIKTILFDDQRRINEKNKIISLCGDSVEYFIDDQQWLLLDYLEQDFPFQIKDVNQILSSQRMIDVSDNQYRYLVVFLDFKNTISATETDEELNSSLMMLKQHKKTKYLNNIRDSLFNKAIREGIIIK